jgi:hypothetical protein
MHKYRFLFYYSCLLSIISCSSSQDHDFDLIINQVNIIDYVNGGINPNMDIGIKGERITYLCGHSDTLKKTAKSYIDATGKFIIPGLWDNHVHLRGGKKLIKANKEFLNLFLANGITGIRDAGGDLSNEVIQWKKAIAEGSLTGPVIFTAGPKIDGANPTWEGSIEVSDTSEVKKALDSLAYLQTDFVKIYDSKISREIYLKVLKEAKLRNLITSGHMPFSVLLEENIKNGIGSIEHLYYVLKGCSSKEDEITLQIRSKELGFWDSFEALMESYDPHTASKSFQLLREHNTFVTPTLHIGNVLSSLKTANHHNDTYLELIDSSIVHTYQGRINRALQASKKQTEMRSALQLSFSRLTFELNKAGVSLLAGSDCGAYNSYVYPGISLHEELKALVDAGLTPLEALKTSTYNGADFLKQNAFYGTIAVGKAADMLLLDENPLLNIQNTRKINTVILKGKVFSKDRLNMLIKATMN